MRQSQVARIKEAVVKAASPDTTLSPEQEREIENAIAINLPPEAYKKAVIFLGSATLVLALGSILLAGLGQEVSEALWGALGAGIGGLAGIFMGKEQ